MPHRLCPWWIGYPLICPLRRFGQNPDKILAPYVREGMIVLEPGPGMGFFTLALARMVGPSGRIIAVDIQSKMLERLKRRAAKVGLMERIETRLASSDSLEIADLGESIDFTLAFAVVHELSDVARFLAEVSAASKVGATLLLAEPKGHVKEPEFQSQLQAASQAGFNVVDRPAIGRSHVALLKKK